MANACSSKCNRCDGHCNSSCYSKNTCDRCVSGCNNNCDSCNSCNTGCDTTCNSRCYQCQVCYSGCNLDQSCQSCNICNSACHNWYTNHYNETGCQGYDTTEERLLCYDKLPTEWALCHNQDKKDPNCSGVYGQIPGSSKFSNRTTCKND